MSLLRCASSEPGSQLGLIVVQAAPAAEARPPLPVEPPPLPPPLPVSPPPLPHLAAPAATPDDQMDLQLATGMFEGALPGGAGGGGGPAPPPRVPDAVRQLSLSYGLDAVPPLEQPLPPPHRRRRPAQVRCGAPSACSLWHLAVHAPCEQHPALGQDAGSRQAGAGLVADDVKCWDAHA